MSAPAQPATLSCPGKVHVTQSWGGATAASSSCESGRTTSCSHCVIYNIAMLKHSQQMVISTQARNKVGWRHHKNPLVFLDGNVGSALLIQTEIFQQLFNGVPWKFVQMFIVPTRWILMTLVIPQQWNISTSTRWVGFFKFNFGVDMWACWCLAVRLHIKGCRLFSLVTFTSNNNNKRNNLELNSN